MVKRIWPPWRRTGRSRGSPAREPSDAEILHQVGQWLETEAGQRSPSDEQQLWSRVRDRIAWQAYLVGDASLEDIRSSLHCQQCARILEAFRRHYQSFGHSGGERDAPSGERLPSATPSHHLSLRRRLSVLPRAHWKPFAMGAITCLLTVSVALLVLPWFFPNANAILRFSGQPNPLVKERGRLADKVAALLRRSKRVIYVAPSEAELRAMEEAVELVTLSLRVHNESLLAEASQAADQAGYRIVDFEDTNGLKALILEEKPDRVRGRGTFFFRRDHYDGRLIIVASHALRDVGTGWLGFECFSRIPGADAFLLSGARSDYVDEAHTRRSIFNAVFRAAMRPQAICLSLHGFDEKRPGRAEYPDVVISSGAITEPVVRQLHVALASEMEQFVRVGVYDGKHYADISGTMDQQGILTSSVNSLFAHIEFSRAVRRDPAVRARLIDALAGVLGNVDVEIISSYARPGRQTVLTFTTVAKVPLDLLAKYGHNAILMNRSSMERLQLRAGDPALVSSGERQAVARVYPYESPAGRLYLSGAMRRRLSIGVGSYTVRVSRLPE